MKITTLIENTVGENSCLAEELKANYPETKFYTGHCTGEIPYGIMKEIMGEQLECVHSGDRFEI